MSRLTILIIDDDIEFLRASTMILSKEGYAVAGASNPGAAMDYLTTKTQHFDLVITDLRMPGMDGLTVLQIVRKSFPEVPVVVLTAYGGTEFREETLHAGAFAYLNKPIDRRQLLDVIDKALKASQTPQ